MSFRALIERMKDSLLLIPLLFVAGGLLLAWITNRLDTWTETSGMPLLIPATQAGTRTLLGAIAGATITVAAVVFSITALTVQLSASQFSPRVLQGFLRDRFQQAVVGVVVGTFTYSLVSLAAAGSESIATSWTSTVGMGLGVISVIAIVAFIDHMTRRIRVDEMIERLADQTSKSLEKNFADRDAPARPLGHRSPLPDGDSWVVRATDSGWVVDVDHDGLLDALAPGSIARVDVRIGEHVARDDALVTVWSDAEADDDTRGHLRRTVELSDTRTVVHDPAFGIRQLVDIALRALSPGINDPATAADVVQHLVGPVRTVLLANVPTRFVDGPEGRRIVLPNQFDGDDYVRAAFTEIRLAAGAQPHVLQALVSALGSLRLSLVQADLERRSTALDEQIRLLGSAITASGLVPEDLSSVAAEARRYDLDGLVTDGDG